jgi:hypothetical protein
MATAIEPGWAFQEADDGPGQLTSADHEKVPFWDNTVGAFVMRSLPEATVYVDRRGRKRQGLWGGGGTPVRIQGATDGPGDLGAGDNGKALVWNNTTGRFEMAVVSGGDADTLDGLDSTDFELSGAAAAAVGAHAALTSGVHGISAFGATLIDDAAASNARTTLELGTAAVLNVGVLANNVVQLDGTAKLPAVDGSQLTNLPGGGGGTPGGSVGQVQVHGAGGVFAGDAGFTYDSTTDTPTVAGNLLIGSGHSFPTAAALSIRRSISAANAFGFVIEGTYTGSGSGSAYGMYFNPTLVPPDTKQAFFGYFGGAVQANTGISVTANGLFVSSLTKSGSGTISNAYGLYVSDQSVGTNNWTVYGPAGRSFLAELYVGGTSSMLAALAVRARFTTWVPIVARGESGQSANLFEARISTDAVQFGIGETGRIKTNQSVANTNTPSGATARALEIFDVAGASLGFIPVYAAQW